MRLVPFLVFLVLAAELEDHGVNGDGEEEFDFRSRVLHIPKGYFRIQDNALPQGEEAASTFVECLERVSKAGKCDGDMARAKAKYGAIPDKVDQVSGRNGVERRRREGPQAAESDGLRENAPKERFATVLRECVPNARFETF